MKKYTACLLMLVLCLSLLTGCGDNYEAQTSTLFVLKNGSIVTTDVVDFPDTYDQAGLEESVNNAISAYVAENGDDTVSLQSLTVENGVAYLTLKYASAQDYSSFYDNEYEVFDGSIAEALAAGYDFNVDFADVTGDQYQACSSSAFLTDDDYKVVVVRANVNVQVKGKICYVSTENVSMVDNKTISIAEGNDLFGEENASTETSETVEATEVVEPTEAVDEGAVSEDEMLLSTEEETQVVFEFDEEEEAAAEEQSEYTNVYTYIIYK